MTAATIQEHDVTVYLGDAATVVREQPPGSVQCIVTSPPYYGLRDYGVQGQLGLEESPADYVAAMVGVFAEARRVLADDGVLWLNVGDSYNSWPSGDMNRGFNERSGNKSGARKQESSQGIGRRRGRPVPGMSAKNLLLIPQRLSIALQDDGWIVRKDVIWAKRNCMPEPVRDRPASAHEYHWLLSKSDRYWYDAEAIREDSSPEQEAHNARYAKVYDIQAERAATTGQPGNVNSAGIHSRPGAGGRHSRSVWTISQQPFAGAHFACMPPELVRRSILAGCPEGGTVYDPFTGSGTTAMVARSLGRKFVGSELNPDYFDIIRDRIGPTPFEFAVTAEEGAS